MCGSAILNMLDFFAASSLQTNTGFLVEYRLLTDGTGTGEGELA